MLHRTVFHCSHTCFSVGYSRFACISTCVGRLFFPPSLFSTAALLERIWTVGIDLRTSHYTTYIPVSSALPWIRSVLLYLFKLLTPSCNSRHRDSPSSLLLSL